MFGHFLGHLLLYFYFVCWAFFARYQLLLKGLASVNEIEFYGRMLVEWKEANGTLDAGFLKHMEVACVWAGVALCSRLWSS